MREFVGQVGAGGTVVGAGGVVVGGAVAGGVVARVAVGGAGGGVTGTEVVDAVGAWVVVVGSGVATGDSTGDSTTDSITDSIIDSIEVSGALRLLISTVVDSAQLLITATATNALKAILAVDRCPAKFMKRSPICGARTLLAIKQTHLSWFHDSSKGKNSRRVTTPRQ
jgi:hypothetical protein